MYYCEVLFHGRLQRSLLLRLAHQQVKSGFQVLNAVDKEDQVNQRTPGQGVEGSLVGVGQRPAQDVVKSIAADGPTAIQSHGATALADDLS